MKRLAFLAAVACLWDCALPGSGRAGMIDFSYNGSGIANVSGAGSFSFAGNLMTVALADLTSFTFSDTTTESGLTTTYSYGLANLTAFSATLSTGGLLTGLSLDTNDVAGSNPVFQSERFEVTSLDTDGAETVKNDGAVISTGTVTQTTAAEPATLTLLGLGVASLAGFTWRRRR
jgi:hypothetical protein